MIRAIIILLMILSIYMKSEVPPQEVCAIPVPMIENLQCGLVQEIPTCPLYKGRRISNRVYRT